MKRRYFLSGMLAPALCRLRASAARRKVLLCLIDGLGPDYVARSEMPYLKKLMNDGVFRFGKGVMPSLTNVNNASFATGTFPERHGITSNTWLDRRSMQVMEMSAPSLLRAPTLFDHARRRGRKTALVAAKHKIQVLLGARADRAFSAEKPAPEAVALAGEAPNLYSPEANYWVFRAGRALLRQPEVDLLYLTTTDYMMHTYAPDEAPSLAHLHRVDQMLAEMVDDHPDLELYLTADHGMNAKTEAVDPIRVLAAKGIESAGVPAIRDKHKTHHQDLGGSLYLDLKDPRQVRKAVEALSATDGVEEALPRREAAKRYRLDASRIGDVFVIMDRTTAVGLLAEPRLPVKVRTHGSLHETEVPLLAWGRKLDPERLKTSVDLSRERNWELEWA